MLSHTYEDCRLCFDIHDYPTEVTKVRLTLIECLHHWQQFQTDAQPHLWRLWSLFWHPWLSYWITKVCLTLNECLHHWQQFQTGAQPHLWRLWSLFWHPWLSYWSNKGQTYLDRVSPSLTTISDGCSATSMKTDVSVLTSMISPTEETKIFRQPIVVSLGPWVFVTL